MKIGFILYDYYPFGGLQEDCLLTAMTCRARGHDVHIFTRSWKGHQPDELNIHILGKKGLSNLSRNQHFFAALDKQLPAFNLDGIVAFNRCPQADIYFAADPCFLERKRNARWWQKASPRYKYYAGLEANLFRRDPAPETLVLTDEEITAFHKHYQIPKNHFHLLPPGIDRNKLSAEEQSEHRLELRRELGTPQNATVALFVGSGFRVKGLDRALKAVTATTTQPDTYEFWVVGNGKSGAFRKLAKDSAANVRFLGGRADTHRFYSAADFLLHPAYSESAGKVLLEALSFGLPVITTDTCGYAPHISNAQAGAVLPSPFSQEQLNAAVKNAFEDAEKREAWSHKARDYADKEDLYSCHEAAAQLIEKLLPRAELSS